MLFNSLQFLLFFIIVCSLYYLLPLKLRWLWLLLASCYFYAVLNPYYIFILATAILIDYSCGLALEYAQKHPVRRMIILLSILSNIAILAYFKYYNFFIDNMQDVFHAMGSSKQFNMLSLVLPIGLSFHTFQSMSYCIEVYRGRQKTERNLIVFALYVMFFPQLVAGPIERPYHLLNQLKIFQGFSTPNIKQGLLLMAWGLFKKVVISDRLAMYINQVNGSADQYSSYALMISSVFFAFQIYCDFSGYSDIARGSARVLGYDLMINFNTPYFATSIREFWTRWHISLSSWFRDYVYIPLGGSRVPFKQYVLNILIVFFLSGLWHGANWTFIVWGLLHGIFTILSSDTIFSYRLNYKPLAIALTFTFVCITWVFFRSLNVQDAVHYLQRMFSFKPGLIPNDYFSTMQLLLSAGLIGLLLICEKYYIERILSNRHFYLKCLCFALLLYFFGVFNRSQFIYFQF